MKTYIDWLKENGIKLYYDSGIYWQIYQGALIPASPFPIYINLNKSDGKKLLKESKALFIRYTNDPTNDQMPWWYISCQNYDLKEISSKMRNQIKRGQRDCKVIPITSEWLSYNGYDCHRAAYKRYNNTDPINKTSFQDGIRMTESFDIFEYWGVFVSGVLAGYCQCITEENKVATNVIKYHPGYLQYYTSYALISTLLQHYVAERGMIVSNGARSISHDTNMQDHLMKFGFIKQYCRLHVSYRSTIGFMVNILYPFRSLINKLHDQNNIHNLQSVLFQEQLRRECFVDS